jgi:hypothetical protein
MSPSTPLLRLLNPLASARCSFFLRPVSQVARQLPMTGPTPCSAIISLAAVGSSRTNYATGSREMLSGLVVRATTEHCTMLSCQAMLSTTEHPWSTEQPQYIGPHEAPLRSFVFNLSYFLSTRLSKYPFRGSLQTSSTREPTQAPSYV